MRELTFTEAAREGLSEEMAGPSVSSSAKGSGRGGNFNTTTGLFERHGAERLRVRPSRSAASRASALERPWGRAASR